MTITSSYFEGNQALSAFGYNRDGKKAKTNNHRTYHGQQRLSAENKYSKGNELDYKTVNSQLN